MLDLCLQQNEWQPLAMSDEQLLEVVQKHYDELPFEDGRALDYLLIFQTEPYVDSVFVRYDYKNQKEPTVVQRFTLADGYFMEPQVERLWDSYCVQNEDCKRSFAALNTIYDIYSKQHPEWNLKRYYSRRLRLLDHLYHCMRKNSIREMLYKAGLDELALGSGRLDEVNLMSTKPTEIYEGVSMRALRALNCRDGAHLLETRHNREFIRGLQSRYAEVFKQKLNDAQCRYLNRLISGNLTMDEVYRLFQSRRPHLMQIWNRSQYELFLLKEQNYAELEELKKIDPIYRQYLKSTSFEEYNTQMSIANLKYYLLHKREEMDAAIRRSNRIRNDEWQERGKDYIVRYPQTINDFCREAVYMGNCLMTYVEAMVHNDTTILFIRKADDVNQPFITLEIYDGCLIQARHRFNQPCDAAEKKWIEEYCVRHGIRKRLQLPEFNEDE